MQSNTGNNNQPIKSQSNPPQSPSSQQADPYDEMTEIQNLFTILDKNPNIPKDLRDKASAMVHRLQKMLKYGSFSREFEPISKYVNWIASLPWGIYTIDDLDIVNVKKELDSTHYGLENVKERIVEYIAMMNLKRRNELEAIEEARGVTVPDNNSQVEVQNDGSPALSEYVELTPIEELGQSGPVKVAQLVSDGPGVVVEKGGDKSSAVSKADEEATKEDMSAEMSRLQGSSSHAPIICFVGVQGIGKTSIAKSIARALGRKFVRISLGALGGVLELRGKSRGELDAEPGQIIKALARTQVMNPVILLDEVDKVSSATGLRADVMAALLEILDPEQNSTFQDHYMDFPIDLSQVIFITTANNLGGISAALLDRLEIVRMSSYSDEEKQHIAKDYLLPKVMAASGVKKDQITFHDEVWPLIIRPLGFDAGIRQLERTITNLTRKVARKIVAGEGEHFDINPQNFREYIPMDIGVYS